MKTVLFVPGGMEYINSRDYKSVLKTLETSEHKVKYIQINWARTTIDHWVEELDREYNKYSPEEVILAGFSWGSFTAFMSATKRNPSELWLFSFSPYFSEDLPKFKKSWLTGIGHRRVTSFSKLNFNKLVKLINCKTVIFAGEAEPPLLINRCKIAHRKIDGSKLVMIPNTKHDIADPKYLEAIKTNI